MFMGFGKVDRKRERHKEIDRETERERRMFILNSNHFRFNSEINSIQLKGKLYEVGYKHTKEKMIDSIKITQH